MAAPEPTARQWLDDDARWIALRRVLPELAGDESSLRKRLDALRDVKQAGIDALVAVAGESARLPRGEYLRRLLRTFTALRNEVLAIIEESSLEELGSAHQPNGGQRE